ncbi:MAG: molybdenum cofactor biosynthesis protein MoaE [Verrucomicrobiota bacterium]
MKDPIISISTDSVEKFESQIAGDTRYGADIRFLGVVRGIEADREITGIDYSCYEPMAHQMFRKLCDELAAEHANHRILIHHRIGFVAAGEPSIVIRVQTPHSAEGFELCQEYLKRIKKTVPIWKNPVYASAAAGAADEPA